MPCAARRGPEAPRPFSSFRDQSCARALDDVISRPFFSAASGLAAGPSDPAVPARAVSGTLRVFRKTTMSPTRTCFYDIDRFIPVFRQQILVAHSVCQHSAASAIGSAVPSRPRRRHPAMFHTPRAARPVSVIFRRIASSASSAPLALKHPAFRGGLQPSWMRMKSPNWPNRASELQKVFDSVTISRQLERVICEPEGTDHAE